MPAGGAGLGAAGSAGLAAAAPIAAPLIGGVLAGKALGLFNEGGKAEESLWDKAKKAASKAWKNDNLRDPKHPWSHVGQNRKTLNMGGMIPQGYNAGGWVQARMQHLNHGGMAMDQAGMQAYNEMQGMTGEGTTMPGDMMPPRCHGSYDRLRI